MSAVLGERDVLMANERALTQARDVVQELPRDSEQFTASTTGGKAVALPPELSAIVGRILRVVAAGGTVTVGAMPEELTTTTAAKQLGVSRPTLMKMIKAGEITAHKVGTHTRLRTADVLQFQRQRQQRRRAAFDELRALEDED
ncbi:DNA binding domain-containing protein, excisionase family [Amycolatopsis marina]|uniref:DNA binding domain-containing protein, excisionase family n=1 Tax=Amycolatopsis marina TaxID=490629 RepID=A0A1I0W8D2_9PSEU|nr:DNA binding domain-containing protein, excisionase family [Amycolatopsis marina]